MTACLRAGIVILIVEGLRKQWSGKRFGPRANIIIVICSQIRISVALIGTKTPQMIVFVVYKRDFGVIFTSVGDGQQATPVIVSVCKKLCWILEDFHQSLPWIFSGDQVVVIKFFRYTIRPNQLSGIDYMRFNPIFQSAFCRLSGVIIGNHFDIQPPFEIGGPGLN